jgi:hypothetical protein
LLVYCLIPGTDGENDYGDAPGPNSTLVNVGAVLAILMQLGSIGAQSKMDSMGGYNAYREKSVRAEKTAGKTVWQSPDGAMSIKFPGTPQEVPNAATMPDGSGSVRQFTSSARGTAYMVQVLDLGRPAPDEEAIADKLSQSVIGDGKLIEVTGAPQFGQRTARDVGVTMPGGMTRSVRFVVAGSKVYMAMAVFDDKPASMLAVDSFMDSFTLNR